jgi:hypothetical protein
MFPCTVPKWQKSPMLQGGYRNPSSFQFIAQGRRPNSGGFTAQGALSGVAEMIVTIVNTLFQSTTKKRKVNLQKI